MQSESTAKLRKRATVEQLASVQVRGSGTVNAVTEIGKKTVPTLQGDRQRGTKTEIELSLCGVRQWGKMPSRTGPALREVMFHY